MKLIFCSDPLHPRHPDPAYTSEISASEQNAIPHHLLDFEALANHHDLPRALRRIPESATPEIAIYRGWMLKPQTYAALATALQSRGLHLINTPDAYRHTHHLPESYDLIRSATPQTAWLRTNTAPNRADLLGLLQPFGSKPLILKDFVKSRKHEWHDACFIPSAADTPNVEKVIARFLHLQANDLNEGLVFREFIDLAPLATHSRSGMPLTQEFRIFFLDGLPLYSTVYWDEGDYNNATIPTGLFAEIARSIRSRFFTMDIAQKRDGSWIIIELGDGQVSGLPDRADPVLFYKNLAQRAINLS